MKAVYINAFGGRDKLIYGELPKPQPGEGEVLVRIKAAGVNPVDWKIRQGILKERGFPHQFPLILGWDMAGVIEEHGHSARRFEINDAVFGYCRRPTIHLGTYAEYIALPESYITAKPKKLSFEQAAGAPLTSLIAYQSVLEAGALKKGQSFVIIGASGGVGSFAVQYGKIKGAKVLALTSSKNHDYLRKLGADITVDYAVGDFRTSIQKFFPKGADFVFACAGGESLLKSYDCVKKGGRLVTIVERGDESLAKSKGIQLHYVFVEPNVRQLEQISQWLDKGQLKLTISKVFPLAEAAQAHEAIETAHTRGKIVLKI